MSIIPLQHAPRRPQAMTNKTTTSPVGLGDISLFVVCNEQAITIPPALLSPAEMAVLTTTSGMTYQLAPVQAIPLAQGQALRIAAVPQNARALFPSVDITDVATALYAAMQKILPPETTYLTIFHIGETNARYMARPARHRDFENVPRLSSQQVFLLLSAVQEAEAAHRALSPAETSIGTLSFDHYSPQLQRRGYLFMDTHMALLLDSAEQDAHILLGIMQQGLLTAGAVKATYADMVMRLSLWDANCDTQAILQDFTINNRNASRSTRGQVLLNFALAGIGVVLTLVQIANLPHQIIVATLVLFSSSAIAHAFVALFRSRFFDWVGIVLLSLAGAATLTMLARLLLP